jgi:putative addiction module component (TIGR02574 family)
MAMTKEQILHEAMALDPKQRDELAEQIWQSIVPGELSDDQLAELRRRAHAVDSGEMATVDGETVMRELFERLTRAKAG